jgi:hypothetical protein
MSTALSPSTLKLRNPKKELNAADSNADADADAETYILIQ